MALERFVIDSSIFIAFYWGRDTQHEVAVRVMEELVGNVLLVHPYVIQEVTTVLARRLGITVAKKFLNDIQDAKDVNIVPISITEESAYFSTLNMPVSFTDAALINLARRERAPLITFDRQMLRLYQDN